MKRFVFCFLFLLSLLFFVSFFVTAAVHGPNECCKLNHEITDCGNEGQIIGADNPKWCDVDGDETMTGAELNPRNVDDWATCCFLDSIYTASDWLITIFMALSLIIFGIAGYLFLFSGGNPGKIEQGKAFVLYGIIALFLVLLSKVIPAVIKAIVS